MITQNTALFTIFGATGDLAHRKLYPSLFRLYKKGFIKDNFAVIGTARREWTDVHFREVVLDSIKDLIEDKEDAISFAAHFYYIAHKLAIQVRFSKILHFFQYVLLKKRRAEGDLPSAHAFTQSLFFYLFKFSRNLPHRSQRS